MMSDLRNRIRWQMLFRTAFLLVMAFSGVVLHLFYGDPLSNVLVRLLVLGCAFSILSIVALRFTTDSFLVPVAWGQILWDLVYTSLLVYFTGGILSAFMMLYALQIFAGAAVLSSSGAIGSSLGSIMGLFIVVMNQGGFSAFLEGPVIARMLLLVSVLLLVGGSLAQFFRNRENLAKSLEMTTANLKDLSNLHAAIVDHIPSGIIYLDAKNIVHLMNSAAHRILKESLVGKNLTGSSFEVLLRPTGRFESEISMHGQKKFIGHHLTALPDGGSVVVFQDVTDFRDLEKKMALKEKLASVGQLAAGIAHEIRNPLASISGSIQLLSSELELAPAFSKLMKIVLRETDRLDHLANSFLNYARPSNLKLEQISVASLLEDVLALIKNSNQFKSDHVLIQTEISKELVCVCDAYQLKQILWNLIINSIQAISEKGEVKIRVFSSVMDSRASIKFTIQDTGVGIDPSVKERIFDPFFTTKATGSGLGLALVYQMIRSHEGKIGVESQEGVGTKLWFELLKEGPQTKATEGRAA